MSSESQESAIAFQDDLKTGIDLQTKNGAFNLLPEPETPSDYEDGSNGLDPLSSSHPEPANESIQNEPESTDQDAQVSNCHNESNGKEDEDSDTKHTADLNGTGVQAEAKAADCDDDGKADLKDNLKSEPDSEETKSSNDKSDEKTEDFEEVNALHQVSNEGSAHQDSDTDPLQTEEAAAAIEGESKKSPAKKSRLPDVVSLVDEEDEEEESDEDEIGNPDRPPGDDSSREIEPDHLLPFHHGWRREVIVRKGNNQIATQYDIFYLPPESGQYRTREAKRKRTSKVDQEKYFADFPSPVLSIKNFSYVRRPLGLNNAAYEIMRKGEPATEPEVKEKPSTSARIPLAGGGGISTSTTPSKGRRISSYKEVEESTGLLADDSDGDNTDDEVVCINGFDIIAPISLQVNHVVLGLRAEHKKRQKKKDPQTCCTPPLAEDMLWSGLDDDPMGIYNELGGRSSPTTPPPLRAVQLTPLDTADKIRNRYSQVRESASKKDFLEEQELHDNLASHDVAIRLFKNFKGVRHSGGYISSYGQHQRQNTNSRYASSLIMKPVLNHMRNLPGISWSASGSTPRNLRPCSLQCPGTNGAMPDLQCILCQRLYHARCQGAVKQARMFKCRLCLAGGLASGDIGSARGGAKESIRMKLPMHPVNGKRPVVELVMLQNGKYQPIKFSNNVQVTETIPKSLFEQANSLKKTVYQKATQVPRVGNNTIYIAVNPTNRPTGQNQQPQQKSSTSAPNHSEQVSILVKPQKGGKPVLLNVPRKIALKVKNGTTLSFSASSDQKYIVISNKIHPPVGATTGTPTPGSQQPRRPGQPSPSATSTRPPMTSSSLPQQQRPKPPTGLSLTPTKTAQTAKSIFAGILPSSVSLEPVPKGQITSATVAAAAAAAVAASKRRPAVSVSINRASEPVAKTRKLVPGGNVLSSGEVIASSSTSTMTPCTPYCPGVSGFPELECQECQSLFHTKCVGIPQVALPKIKGSFRCKMCIQRKSGHGPSSSVQVIDLD